MSTLTTRLSGMLRRMRGDKKVRVSASRHSEAVASLEAMSDNDKSPERGGLLARISGASRREATVNHLQEGFNEVVDLIRTVRVHLDQQADRSERLLGLMENLPGALEAMPEASRNQSRMAEAMNAHAEMQNRQAMRLNETLGSLASASEHQSQVMGALQHQIEASNRTDEQLLGSFSAINQTLIQLSQSSQAGVQTLRRVTDQSDRSTQRVENLMRRSVRTMTVMSITAWIAAAAALGVAAWALLTSSGALN